MMLSGSPVWTGYRVCGLVRTIRRRSSVAVPTGIATRCTRGTMTCAGRQVAELEQLAQNPPGLTAKQALFLAFLDDELKLLGAVVPLLLGDVALDADGPHDNPSNRVERHDERQCRFLDRLDDGRHPHRGARCALQRECFRHLLAEQDVRVGQDGDGYDARRRCGP